MKRVLIAGSGSYLGDHIAKHLWDRPEAYAADVLDMRTEAWKRASLAGYDCVVDVAGIAHHKETEEIAALCFAVNRDLALELARRAKEAGVGQFVYLSSMSVYGLHAGRVTAQTAPAPATAYGRSKLEAEEGLFALADERFRVAALRPPMVYGKGCKGNYPRLAKLICTLRCYPRTGSERSLLYIDCLCGFVRRLIESGAGGLYFPQNKEYARMDELAALVAKAHGVRLWQPRGLSGLLRWLGKRSATFASVFGTLTYDRSMSAAFADEPQPDFAETIARTEGDG